MESLKKSSLWYEKKFYISKDKTEEKNRKTVKPNEYGHGSNGNGQPVAALATEIIKHLVTVPLFRLIWQHPHWHVSPQLNTCAGKRLRSI